MRDIRFRGKRLDNGGWRYGFYGVVSNAICQKHIIVEHDLSYVDPATVGQYTGFKDCNGNKIYEGDILDINSESPVVVIWEEYYAMFNLNTARGQCVAGCTKLRLERASIIGNIHDNPELLKGGGK